MAAVRLLLCARFRHRWRSWLSLFLLIALVSGLVLAGVVAGRRTATAFRRFEADAGARPSVCNPSERRSDWPNIGCHGAEPDEP